MLAESEEKSDFRNVKLKHIGNHLEDVRLSNIRFTSEPVTFSLRNCDPSHKTNKRVPHTNSFFHRGTRNSVDFTRLWFRTFDKYDMGTQRLQVIKYLCLQCVKNTHRNDKPRVDQRRSNTCKKSTCIVFSRFTLHEMIA